MIRVLLVSNMYAYPGNWDKLDALGKAVQLEVVTPAQWATDRELHPIAEVPRHVGGTWVHHPLPTITQGNPFRYTYQPLPLLRVLRRFRPQIVHVEQEPESLSLLQLSFLKLVFGYRLVFVAWENVNPLRLGWGFRKLNFALADGGIFGNVAALERARRLGFRGPAEVLAQYGFEPGEPTPSPSRERPFTVGYAGRLVPEKGIATLLDALAATTGTNLVVAGDGPLRDSVTAEPRATWLGNLDRTAMAAFWAGLDAFVLPSLTTRPWAEQFGRVIVEAMAQGVPVIGSTSGAIPEVIGDAGIVVPEGDAAALAAALQRLRDDPALRAQLAAAGRARLQLAYSHEVVTEGTLDFYDRVLRRLPAS